MLPCGAKLWALSAAEVDAQKVIRHIVGKDMRLTLALQTEIVDHGYPLQDTQAGKILYGDVSPSFRRIDKSMDSCKEEAAAMLASLNERTRQHYQHLSIQHQLEIWGQNWKT